MADLLPLDTTSMAQAELTPAEYSPSPTDLARQAADCETLRAAREASHSESDRIAYALAAVLITHPGCCSKDDGGQS